MSFGENLRTIRRERGMTQEQLAEMLEVSRQAVSKWEAEGGYPEAEKLILLAKKLDVSLDRLMDNAVEESLPVQETAAAPATAGSILIPVFDGSKPVSCLSVKYDKIAFPAKKEPPFILSGIDRFGVFGEHSVILGWYEDEETVKKELLTILDAIEKRHSLYTLQYFSPVRFTAFGTAARVEKA